MKLTILGKYGPYPKTGGACSGYLLQAGALNLMLDCGSGTLSRLQYHCAIHDLSAIVLSHLHSDHMADMLVLRYGLPAMLADGRLAEPLPLYMPAEPADVAGVLIDAGVFAVHTVKGGDVLTLEDATLRFYSTRHLVPCNTVRIEHGGASFVYSGDLNTTPGFEDFARGADFLLIDGCLSCARWSDKAPHLSSELAAQVAASAGVGRVVLTHIHPEIDESVLLDEAHRAHPLAELAQEGACYQIG